MNFGQKQNSALFIVVFIFFMKRLVRLLTLQVHLMHLTSIKFAKTCTKLISRHPSASGYGLHRLTGKLTNVAPPQRGQLRQPAAADLTIWQCTMPTLSQRLGCFPSESRAGIFLQCRQDCPLLPPINRGGFDGLREDKIGSKNRKKPASPLFPFSFFPRQPSAALSTSPQLPSSARIPTNPAYTPPRTPAPPQEANTTIKQPPRLSLSFSSGLSLSSANFFFLRSSNSGAQALHQRRHQHDHRPSQPQVVLHPCLASTVPVAHCCCRCMQNSFCMQRPK